jgi:hypothetical protein
LTATTAALRAAATSSFGWGDGGISVDERGLIARLQAAAAPHL